MKHMLSTALTAFALSIAAPCQAPSPATTTDGSQQGTAGTFVLEPGTIQLDVLIERVGAFLDYNLLYNGAELSSTGNAGIRLTRRTEVDRKGCWELFHSLLYHKGFAILGLDKERGFYEIVATNGSRSREVQTGAMFVPYAEVEAYSGLKAIPILTSVPLQNVNATIATNALRPFFASTGGGGTAITLGNVGNSSDLLLQGFGPQVAAACHLLRLIDIGDDGGKPQVQVVALEHATAADIVARLEDTLGSRAMQSAMQQGLPMGIPLRTVPHPALNAVILSGSTTQLRDALDLIARLDRPAERPNATQDDLLERLKRLEARVQQLEQASGSGK